MNPSRFLCAVVGLWAFGASAPAAEDSLPKTAQVFGIWEGAFGGVADAAPDTSFTLELTSPSGEKRSVPGFWDGGRSWKVRVRPDESGTYKFHSTSKPAVAGLDDISGSFEASPQKSVNPLWASGPLKVSRSGTFLQHKDGKPFFFLADTCWTGPALSTAPDWDDYLRDRGRKRFSAVQFNCVSPWRTAPTDANGQVAYEVKDGKLVPNVHFFHRLDQRLHAINLAGLLAVPVLAWAHKKGDAGFDLSEEQLVALVKYEMARYHAHHCLFVLAGDARYTPPEAEKWKKIGRAVFADFPGQLVTTHPTGMNFPWKDWENEKWLNVLGYQSGHGDDAGTLKWIHSGPPAEYGKRKDAYRPLINLEPPYEDHNGYQSRKPHPAYDVRRAVYWSLLSAPVAGVTYGGHGLWSWHAKPGEEPTDHPGTGVAKVWREALELPGAAQMGHVRKFFESLPWTELRPTPQFVGQESGKTDPAKFVACAYSDKSNTFVYYFPAGARAQILLHIRGLMDNVTWFNPRTGAWGRPEKEMPGRGFLEPPDEEDWAVVVKP
jgi:hypothetical protein